MDAGALAIWCCAKYWSWPVLSQLNGLMTWLSIHHRLALPFLNQSHRFLHSHKRVPDHNVRLALCEALFHATRVLHKPLFFCHPKVPRFLHWVFWDANCEHGYVGIVISSINGWYREHSVPLPALKFEMGPEGQQSAELYALKVAFVKAALLNMSNIQAIGDSQSALFSFSALKLSCPSRLASRAKVLRQIVRLADKHFMSCQLAYLPFELNPADNPTKPLLCHSTSARSKAFFCHSQPCVLALMPDAWPMHKAFLESSGIL